MLIPVPVSVPEPGKYFSLRRARCHFHNCHRRARDGRVTMTIVKVAPVSSMRHSAPDGRSPKSKTDNSVGNGKGYRDGWIIRAVRISQCRRGP